MVDSGSLFVLNSETISWYNFQVSQCAGHFRLPFVFFRAVTMQCITQEGTNLKAGQSCSPEKVCLQHFNRQFTRGSVGTPEGNSRISGNHGIQRRAPLLVSKTLKASKHFRNHWIHWLAPLNFGSWTLEGFPMWTLFSMWNFTVTQIICLDSLVLNIEPDLFIGSNPRIEIHLPLKERVACLHRQVCNLLGHLILWDPME